MATQRESQPSVTLFPFLAVLVCAMGALILLLLVITRQLRNESLPPVLSVAAEAATETELPPVPSVVASAPADSPPQIASASVAAPPTWEPPPRTPPPVDNSRELAAAREEQHFRALREAEREQQQLESAWAAQFAQLRSQYDALCEAVADLQQAQAQRQTALRAAMEEREAAGRELAALTTAGSQLNSGTGDLSARRQALRVEIDRVAAALEQRSHERERAAARQFTIVPFDPRSGTSRRPIVIECRKSELVFVAEEITLSARDLEGFLPQFNPLAAGARALLDGWKVKTGEQPYILLIVRGEGTVGYYVARLFLASLNVPFGYELVGDDMELAWPPTDPVLREECRAAIQEVLSRRDRIASLARGAGGGEGPLSISSSRGDFRLDEIDRLRSPGRTIQFGAQRLDRDSHTSSSGGGLFQRRDEATSSTTGNVPQPSPRSGRSSTESENAGSNSAAGGSSGGGQPAGQRDESTATSVRPPSGGGGGSLGSSAAGEQNPLFDRWRMPLSAGIPFQRDIPLHIYRDSLVIAGGPARSVAGNDDLEPITEELSEVLNAALQEWGQAPAGFYWKPRINFTVHPGGSLMHARLTELVEAWGLGHRANYVRQ